MAENSEGPQLGAGNVKIVIAGEPMELTPSYAAMTAISSRGGGLRGAMERILQLDGETIIDVVTVGLGYGSGRRPPQDLAERIWKTGFMLTSGGVADACFRYVSILGNGGKPSKDDADDDSKGGDEGTEKDPPRGAAGA